MTEHVNKPITSLTDLPHGILSSLAKTGVIEKENERSGSFLHVNQQTIYSRINDIFKNQLIMMDIGDALEKYKWLEDYHWKLVDKDTDEFTRRVHESRSGGYFLWIQKGAKVTIPLQSCLFITEDSFEQRIHNIIIADKGSDAHMISGCLSVPHLDKAGHLGVTEIYVKDNAALHFSMIHHWAESCRVRPRSAIAVDDNAAFVSNYLSLHPVKDVQMYPTAFCNGTHSRVSFNSLIFADQQSKLDTGSRIVLNGRNSSGNIISRGISKNNSTIIARGNIVANTPVCKGHLECLGLLLGGQTHLSAIPELEVNVEGGALSHEAAVGRIADQEIYYLMTRGLSKSKAITAIIRGFMDVGIFGLPEDLNDEIKKLMHETDFST